MWSPKDLGPPSVHRSSDRTSLDGLGLRRATIRCRTWPFQTKSPRRLQDRQLEPCTGKPCTGKPCTGRPCTMEPAHRSAKNSDASRMCRYASSSPPSHASMIQKPGTAEHTPSPILEPSQLLFGLLRNLRTPIPQLLLSPWLPKKSQVPHRENLCVRGARS